MKNEKIYFLFGVTTFTSLSFERRLKINKMTPKMIIHMANSDCPKKSLSILDIKSVSGIGIHIELILNVCKKIGIAGI